MYSQTFSIQIMCLNNNGGNNKTDRLMKIIMVYEINVNVIGLCVCVAHNKDLFHFFSNSKVLL